MKMIPFCIFAVAGFVLTLPSSESTEWTKVGLGDTVILGCNISYFTETIWMRQNQDQIPTVILISGPNQHDEKVVSRNALSWRFTAVPNAEDRTNQLQIINVTDADLALYYCVGRIRGIPQFGKGTRLHRDFDKEYDDSGHEVEVEPQGKEQGLVPFFKSLSFYTVYAALLGLGQLAMICAVFMVHLREGGASSPGLAPRDPRRRQTLAN